MKKKVNGNGQVAEIQKAPVLPPYGVAFGVTPQDLQSGIHQMAMSGYIVHGEVFIQTMKVRWFRRIPYVGRKVDYMCVLMVLE